LGYRNTHPHHHSDSALNLKNKEIVMAQRKGAAKVRRGKDAVALLMDDHKKVKKLFKDFKKLQDGERGAKGKLEITQQICTELSVHTQVEEEIFYPAVRGAIDDDALMDEADVEHAGAKSLIAELKAMKPGDDHYDAKVTVLGEYIDHHVKEEHEEMFPKAKRAKVDMAELGDRITRRKEELQAGQSKPKGFRLFS
jgi:hemerythrin-like domain-containing protein